PAPPVRPDELTASAGAGRAPGCSSVKGPGGRQGRGPAAPTRQAPGGAPPLAPLAAAAAAVTRSPVGLADARRVGEQPSSSNWRGGPAAGLGGGGARGGPAARRRPGG